MPRLWSETLDEHRREVRDAILDTAAGLTASHGLLSVTMSQIAEETGIGRATLYKYFADVEAILAAWHEREISDHLRLLGEVRDGPGDPLERIEAMLVAYARLAFDPRRHHRADLASFLHGGSRVAHGRGRLLEMLQGVLKEAAGSGLVRDDVPPRELAAYCLHAIDAAGTLTSGAAVRRLVSLTLSGLRAPA